MNLHLDWCSYEADKYAIMNWHYSKRMPVGRLNKIGVWESSKFIGCIMFGKGASPNIGKPYLLEQTQVCELVRIALTSHETEVSKMVSIAIKILKTHNPGLKLIVSYADQNLYHYGIIYQAGNWIYTGTIKDDRTMILGKIYHGRSVFSMYGSRSIEWLKNNIDENAKRISERGKHKYLMPLDKEMRKQMLLLSKPYPKRPVSIDVDAPNIPVRNEGGSIPTTGLK